MLTLNLFKGPGIEPGSVGAIRILNSPCRCQNFDKTAIASPVANETTIRIVLILMVMAGWHAEMLDVKGAFLYGKFEDEGKVYIEVPQGFEKFYGGEKVLLLQKTIYGLKQAAMAFWKRLLNAFTKMKFEQNCTDPCLYYAWNDGKLVIWLSWVDDLICIGEKEAVLKAKKKCRPNLSVMRLGNSESMWDTNWTGARA